MTIFLSVLGRIFKQPVNWVFMLIFPVIIAGLAYVNTSGDTVENDDVTAGMRFGVTDMDDSILSRTLVEQLKKRFTIQDVSEDDIAAVLTDSEVPWVLLIRDGYGPDILAGRVPELEGYSLTISDISSLGNVSAQNITRALMLLGTEDPAILAAWEKNSAVDVTILPTDSWDNIAFWLGFYGFISLYTSYFIIKTLIDDKRRGMPDRLGVLPQSTRSVLVQGTLAAFLATEVTAAFMLIALELLMGAVPNTAALFLLLSLYNLFSVGIVFALVSSLRDLGAASVVITMIATVFAMLGGLFWPLDLVPEFMKKLAWISPGYWLARGLGNIREITFEGFGLPILILACFSLIVLLFGGWKKIQPMEED